MKKHLTVSLLAGILGCSSDEKPQQKSEPKQEKHIASQIAVGQNENIEGVTVEPVRKNRYDDPDKGFNVKVGPRIESGPRYDFSDGEFKILPEFKVGPSMGIDF